MSRRSYLAGSALALTVLMMSSAHAQFNLRGLRFPASLQNVFLLRGEGVQNELKLSDKQKGALSELATQLQQDALEIFSGLQDLSPAEQKEQMPEVMKMIETKGKEIQEKVDKILDSPQIERLKQLSLQSRGPTALEDEEVIAALKISDDQKKKLSGIREEGNKALQDAIETLRGGGGDAGQMREKIGKMRKDLGDKALSVLTPAQREQFDKMKGAEFKFPQRGGFPF